MKRQQDNAEVSADDINILVYGLEWFALLVSDATDCAQINTAVPGSLVEEARRSEMFLPVSNEHSHVVVLSRDAARVLHSTL